MPIRVEVLENGRVLYYVVSDPWTVSDLLEAFASDRKHRDEFAKLHPGLKIHIMADIRQAKAIVPGILRAREAPSLKHPTAGEGIVIGATPAMKAISDVVQRLAHQDKASFFDTEEDALTFVRGVIAREG